MCNTTSYDANNANINDLKQCIWLALSKDSPDLTIKLCNIAVKKQKMNKYQTQDNKSHTWFGDVHILKLQELSIL